MQYLFLLGFIGNTYDTMPVNYIIGLLMINLLISALAIYAAAPYIRNAKD